MALTNDLISKGIFNNSFVPMGVVCFTQSPSGIHCMAVLRSDS